MMRQLRFRFIHLAILIVSIGFYTKMRKVSNIQKFLNEQSRTIFDNQIQLDDYRDQFRKVSVIFVKF